MVDEKVVLALKDIAYGSVSGMVSKVFEHPFDLCKVRLQAQVLDTTARFAGPIDCLYKTWKFEGIRGLYRGLPMPIVGAMAENASLFLAYNKIQDTLLQYPHFRPSTNHKVTLDGIAIAGGGAGTVASFLLTPIELIKCKMQVQMIAAEARATPVLAATGAAGSMTAALPRPSFSQLEGPVSLVASVVKSHGVRGLWLGHTGTMIRETGGGAAWFTTKEAICRWLAPDPRDLALHQSAFAGACAGVSYNVFLFPADSIKSTVQTEEELRPRSLGQPRPTFLGTARAIWKAQGVRGFYAGMGVTVARAIPSSAIIFVTYDGLVKYFG
ncbi:L-ornithine transporter [Rhizoctonia solani AG-1 IA]|uniref:L-ornithine transporter n=1 Tax=Thanatephorus cucumeris (strain AG1-IA) TaxID=983506 RepID=L8X7X0_THACA|nr:L-ornithine transporter [Rhizoctonia solani AG-1 IA]